MSKSSVNEVRFYSLGFSIFYYKSSRPRLPRASTSSQACNTWIDKYSIIQVVLEKYLEEVVSCIFFLAIDFFILLFFFFSSYFSSLPEKAAAKSSLLTSLASWPWWLQHLDVGFNGQAAGR